MDSNILYSTLLLALLFGCVVYASATHPRFDKEPVILYIDALVAWPMVVTTPPLRSCVNTPNTHENFVLKRKLREMGGCGVGGEIYSIAGRGFERSWRRDCFEKEIKKIEKRNGEVNLKHRVYRVPGFLSGRPNWVPLSPHLQASVAPHPPFGSKGG